MNIEKARRQRQKGKLLATERLALLLDEHSYVEIAPNEEKDGVYTGYGTVNGEKVFVFALSGSFAGSLATALGSFACIIINAFDKSLSPYVYMASFERYGKLMLAALAAVSVAAAAVSFAFMLYFERKINKSKDHVHAV